MALDLDTATIRRLRDALLASGRADEKVLESAAASTEDRVQASVNRAAPFIETMYLVMVADGQADAAERDAIMGALSMLTHGFLDRTALDTILAQSEAAVAQSGVEARLQMIGARVGASRQDREIAFTLAAAVAMADEQVAGQEHALVQSIAEWYGLSGKRCRELLQQLGAGA